MPRWETVALVGVGLIGGSIGLALRERGLARNVVGIGRRASSLRKARQCGAVSTTTTQLVRGIADAELVIVCTPVELIVENVLKVAEHCPSDALITDVGSIKASIVTSLDRHRRVLDARGVRFVGSHPLAGSGKQGPQHARGDLFEDRVVVVTPSRRSRTTDVKRIEDFWHSLGATVLRKSPQAHDQAVAAISHLPHLVASAMSAATPVEALPLAATGWRDSTRVAAGDAELWRQILANNRDHVLTSLDKFEKVLTFFRKALENGDEDLLTKLLREGKQHRDAVGN